MHVLTQTDVLIDKTVFTIHPITHAITRRLETNCLICALLSRIGRGALILYLAVV